MSVEGDLLDEAELLHAWSQVADKIHEQAIKSGWWQDEEIMDAAAAALEAEQGGVAGSPAAREALFVMGRAKEKLRTLTTFSKTALIMTEVSEGLEGIREGAMSDKISGFLAIEEELADAVIRIMDICKRRDWRIVQAIMAKNEFNKTRAFKHGGKLV